MAKNEKLVLGEIALKAYTRPKLSLNTLSKGIPGA